MMVLDYFGFTNMTIREKVESQFRDFIGQIKVPEVCPRCHGNVDILRGDQWGHDNLSDVSFGYCKQCAWVSLPAWYRLIHRYIFCSNCFRLTRELAINVVREPTAVRSGEAHLLCECMICHETKSFPLTLPPLTAIETMRIPPTRVRDLEAKKQPLILGH